MERFSAPATREELLDRALQLAGRDVAWVAERTGHFVPENLRRHKGWLGELVESMLGATAGSRAEPDFPDLGIELKTIPVDAGGKPRESTYVCVAPIDGSLAASWDDAWVRRKLSTVLWVPIVSDKETPLAQRRFGRPLLWSPDPTEEAALRADWEVLSEMIHSGSFWMIRAQHGEVLQLRPKAANARDWEWALDEDGEWAQTTPLGFYLRATFTRAVLARHYRLR